MSARWWTLGAWALAAASALFWGLKLFVKPPAAPPQTQLAEPGAGLRSDLTRLLGVDPPPPAVAAAAEPAPDARFALLGVVSPRAVQAAREGVALIAIDGKPARAYRVGAVVDGQNVLKSVSARGATLGPRDGASLIALNLAAVAPASTGTLPTPAISGAPPPPRPDLAPAPALPPRTSVPPAMPQVQPPKPQQPAQPPTFQQQPTRQQPVPRSAGQPVPAAMQ